MSRKEQMARAGRSSVAIFHALRLKYWNSDIDFVSCFEGSDDVSFYLPHIRIGMKAKIERVEFLICAGKSNVLNLHKLASDKQWNQNRIGYFVDRDLDDFLQKNILIDKIYLTDFYSIESHSTDEDYFSRIWQEEFKLSLQDNRYLTWKIRYKMGFEKLAANLIATVATALAVRSAGGNVDFDAINLDDLFQISNEGELSKKTSDNPFDLCKVFIGNWPKLSELRPWNKSLRQSDYRTWLRGKFCLWYSTKFFARMKQNLSRRGQAGERAAVKINFNAENGISCLSSYTDAPESLKKYLTKWLADVQHSGTQRIGINDNR